MFGIPAQKRKQLFYIHSFLKRSSLTPFEKLWSIITFFLASFALLLIIAVSYKPLYKVVSPLVASLTPVKNTPQKKAYEIFGFAPYWTLHKLDSVDFSTLTTLAYFGVPITSEGTLDTDDYGYTVFSGRKAQALFQKAHNAGTRVVLTVTIMDNDTIEQFLDSPSAQETAIAEIIDTVRTYKLDGVNVDVEYVGNPGASYRNSFSSFIQQLTDNMHSEMKDSRVTVSVYALSAKHPKLYDIGALGKYADGVFMMAYDFAVTGSDVAMPTAPLYGYKEGKYSYDVSTAVEDFLKVMPAEKLILGVPYYGYNYLIYGEPKIKADTRPSWSWRGQPMAQTYAIAKHDITVEREGWDEVGQVGWKAYYVSETDTWRMIFLDDERSLKIKYDFVKEKKLAGVGMWALGFDSGRTELWSLLKESFGTKQFADSGEHYTDIN